MTVWLITADCGDYYCESRHPLAIATNPKDAALLFADATERQWKFQSGLPGGPRWRDVTLTEVEENTLGEGDLIDA